MRLWRLVGAVLVLAVAVTGLPTPLDICLRSVLPKLVDGCTEIHVYGTGSATASNSTVNGILRLISDCFSDSAQNVSLLAPDLRFTVYLLNQTYAQNYHTVAAGSDAHSDPNSDSDSDQYEDLDSGSVSYSSANASVGFTLAPMAAWGRTLAQIAGVDPALLGLEANSSRPGEFDAWMVDPIALADLYDAKLMLDLSPIVMDTPYRRQIDWVGIHQLFRSSVVLGAGSITSLPLGGLVYQMYYRQDVLADHGLPVPVTWDQFLDTARAVNGTDMDGDGEPDFGVCLQRPRYCFNGFSLAAIWSSFIQTHGTSQGAFFDPNTMEPLVNNSAMVAALDIFRSLRAYGPPDETTAPCSPYNAQFVRGRCALTLSWGYQLKANLFLAASRVRDTASVALLPGSTRVLDRASGKLVPCDSLSVCPYAVEYALGPGGAVQLVNHAPYLAVATVSAAISSSANVGKQTRLLDFFSHLTSRNVSWELVTSPLTELGPYRYEHFDLGYLGEWTRRGYPDRIISEFLSVMKQQLDSPNVMLEVRTVEAYAYRRALDMYATLVGEGALDVAAAIKRMASQLKQVYGPSNPRFETIRKLYRYSIGAEVRQSPAPTASPPPPSEGKRSSVHVAVVVVPVVVVVALAVLAAALLTVYVLAQQRRRLASERGPTGHPGLGEDTTLVVSDVEGSTALWEVIEPAVMDVVFNLHHDCMRRTAVRFAGYESQTEGDSFIIAFHTANAAVQFALAVQQALLEEPWPRELLVHDLCRPVWLARTGVEVPLDIQSDLTAGGHRGAAGPYGGGGGGGGDSRNGTPQVPTPGSWGAGTGVTTPGGFVGSPGSGTPDGSAINAVTANGAKPNLRMLLAGRFGYRQRVANSAGGAGPAAELHSVFDGAATSASGGNGGDGTESMNEATAALPRVTSGTAAAAAALAQPALNIDSVGEALRVMWREVPAAFADPSVNGGGGGTARWHGVKAAFRTSQGVKAALQTQQGPSSSAAPSDTAPAPLPPALTRSRSLPISPLGTGIDGCGGGKRDPSMPHDAGNVPYNGVSISSAGVRIGAESGGGKPDLGVPRDTVPCNASSGCSIGTRIGVDANMDGIVASNIDDDALRPSLSETARGKWATSAAVEAPTLPAKRFSSGSSVLSPPVGGGGGGDVAAASAFTAAGSRSLGRRLVSAGLGLMRSASLGTAASRTAGRLALPQPALDLSGAAAAASGATALGTTTRWGFAQRVLRLPAQTYPLLAASVQAYSSGAAASTQQVASIAAAEDVSHGAASASTLVRRGLAVRIGMHTGVRHATDLQYSEVAARWKYSGEILAAAKSISDAANGGDLLLSAACLQRLDHDILVKRCRLLYVGRHVLRGGDGNGSAAGTTLPCPPPAPAPGAVADLYAIYSPRLLPRLGLYRPPRTQQSLGLSVMDAPLGCVSYGVIVCHGLSSMALHSDSAVVLEAQTALRSISEDQLLACHGMAAAPPGPGSVGSFVGAFRNPYHAILWALQTQEDLLRHPWSADLLAHEQFEEIVVPAAAADALIGPSSRGMAVTATAPPPTVIALAEQVPEAHTLNTADVAAMQGWDVERSGTESCISAKPSGSRLLSNAVSMSPIAAAVGGSSGAGTAAVGGGDGCSAGMDAVCSAPPGNAVQTPPGPGRMTTPRGRVKRNWSLPSHDGSAAGTAGSTGTGAVAVPCGWNVATASQRCHQSAPGDAMPYMNHLTPACGSGGDPAGQALSPTSAAGLPTVTSEPPTGASTTPYDTIYDASNQDPERESATAMNSSGVWLAGAPRSEMSYMPGAPPPTPPGSKVYLNLMSGVLGSEPWAVQQEQEALRLQAHHSTARDATGVHGPAAVSPVPEAVTLRPAAAGGAEGEGDVVLYRGPRIKGAISYGPLKASLDPLTGRIRYEGKAAALASKMVSYAAIGMVVASVQAVEAGHAEDTDGDLTLDGIRSGIGYGNVTPRVGGNGTRGTDGGGAGIGPDLTDRRSTSIHGSAPPTLSRVGSFRDDPEGPSAAMAAAAAAAAAALLNLTPGGGRVVRPSRSASLDLRNETLSMLAAALGSNGGGGGGGGGGSIRGVVVPSLGDGRLLSGSRRRHKQQSGAHSSSGALNVPLSDADADARSSNSEPLIAGLEVAGGVGVGSGGGSRLPSGYSSPLSGPSYSYSQNPLYGTPLKPDTRVPSRTARTMSNLNPDSRQTSRTLLHGHSGGSTTAAAAPSSAAAATPPAALLSPQGQQGLSPTGSLDAVRHPSISLPPVPLTDAAAGATGRAAGLGGTLQAAQSPRARWVGFSPPRNPYALGRGSAAAAPAAVAKGHSGPLTSAASASSGPSPQPSLSLQDLESSFSESTQGTTASGLGVTGGKDLVDRTLLLQAATETVLPEGEDAVAASAPSTLWSSASLGTTGRPPRPRPPLHNNRRELPPPPPSAVGSPTVSAALAPSLSPSAARALPRLGVTNTGEHPEPMVIGQQEDGAAAPDEIPPPEVAEPAVVSAAGNHRVLPAFLPRPLFDQDDQEGPELPPDRRGSSQDASGRDDTSKAEGDGVGEGTGNGGGDGAGGSDVCSKGDGVRIQADGGVKGVPMDPGSHVHGSDATKVHRRLYSTTGVDHPPTQQRTAAPELRAPAIMPCSATGRAPWLRSGDHPSATLFAAGHSSFLQHGEVAAVKSNAAAALAFAAGRSSSLRHGDASAASRSSASAALAFTAGRSSSLRYGDSGGGQPPPPPFDLLRQGQQQHLMMLHQRDSSRLFPGIGPQNRLFPGIGPQNRAATASALVPSVQVLSHSQAVGGGVTAGGHSHTLHNSLTCQHPAQLPPQSPFGTHPHGVAEPSYPAVQSAGKMPYAVSLRTPGAAAAAAAAANGWGQEVAALEPPSGAAASATAAGPPAFMAHGAIAPAASLGNSPRKGFWAAQHPSHLATNSVGHLHPSATGSWRSSNSSAFGTRGGHVAAVSALCNAGVSSRMSGLGLTAGGAGGLQLQLHRPSVPGSTASPGLSRRGESGLGCGGGGGTTVAGGPRLSSELQPTLYPSKTLESVGLDEVTMMPVALKKRGYSQPLVVYLCRFGSSARTFEMQQRLATLGGDTTAAAAVAAAAAAAAATAAAAAESAVTSGPESMAYPTASGVITAAATCCRSLRTSLDDGGGGGAAAATTAASGGGGPSSLSAVGNQISEKLVGFLSAVRFTSHDSPPTPALQAQHQHQHQQAGLYDRLAAKGRRASTTGLYPPHPMPTPNFGRRSLNDSVSGAAGPASLQPTPTSLAAPSIGGLMSTGRPVARPSTGGGDSGNGGGGGFMRRFRRSSLDMPPKRRHLRCGSPAVLARSVGEVRTMSVKRVQRGPSPSGPLPVLSLQAPPSTASATLPTLHAYPAPYSYGVSLPGIHMPPPSAGIGGGPQHTFLLHGGITNPYLLNSAANPNSNTLLASNNNSFMLNTCPLGGGHAAGVSGVVQRAMFRSQAGVLHGNGIGGGVAAVGSAGGVVSSLGGSSEGSQSGTAAVVSDATGAGPSAAINPFAPLLSQQLFVVGYGGGCNSGSNNILCEVGAAWEFPTGGAQAGPRPGAGRAPPLMAPTEEGHETDGEMELNVVEGIQEESEQEEDQR